MRAGSTATGFRVAVRMATKANRWVRGIGAPPSVTQPPYLLDQAAIQYASEAVPTPGNGALQTSSSMAISLWSGGLPLGF